MALICTPGDRSAPLTTGCEAVVAVEMMSAPRTASAAEAAGANWNAQPRGHLRQIFFAASPSSRP